MHPAQFPEFERKVRALHAHYETLTGNKCTLSYQRLEAWKEFIDRGLTADDLATVVRFIREQIRRPDTGYTAASLTFSRLVLDTDLFEDRLNLAREAWRRAQSNKAPAAEAKPFPARWREYLAEHYPGSPIPSDPNKLPEYIQREIRATLRD